MKLVRIGIAFYRSLGETPALIDLRKRITIVIGANNSGKSNILAALQYLKQSKGTLTEFSPTDRHLRDDHNVPRVVIEAEIEPADYFPGKPDGTLVRFVREGGSGWLATPFDGLEFIDVNKYLRRTTGSHYTSIPSPQQQAVIVAQIADRLYGSLLESLPAVTFIPQHRQITPAATYSIHGAGIVELLAAWQHPEIGADLDTLNFQKIQDLLRQLLHLPSVELEVPHDKKTIVVKRDGLRLPLQSYGTGIHQLVVLAIAVLAREGSIICIEEPEVNFHPTLQREFVRFLLLDTPNRYVLSTHSHALIEPNAEIDVLHVALEGKVTVPRLIQTTRDTLSLLHDLGVRASDLLQANAVIWVEGPSDRVYLKRWLELEAPDLIESIHYSIMFYGGRLLAHISLVRDVEVRDLIRLVRINQHSAIVIDSDRRKPRQRLNSTKQRVRAEAEANGVRCWITDGREIENYLHHEAINDAYGELVGSSVAVSFGPYDSIEGSLKHSLRGRWKPGYSYDSAKAQRAREIAVHLKQDHIGSDLRKHLRSLVKLIRSASELYHDEPSRFGR